MGKVKKSGDSEWYFGDACIIDLKTPSKIKPVELKFESPLPGTNIKLAGWGDGPSDRRLVNHWTEIPVVTPETCANYTATKFTPPGPDLYPWAYCAGGGKHDA